MSDGKSSMLFEKVKEIQFEASIFRSACAKLVKKAKELENAATNLVEETMILKEEAIATRCETLSILKLAREQNSRWDQFDSVRISYEEDRKVVQKMFGEVRKAPVSGENRSLQQLRSMFLDLSFLPDFEECRAEEPPSPRSDI